MVDPDKPTKCKIGITTNPDQRLRTYRTAAPQAVYLKLYKVPEKYHERCVLELLKDRFRVDSEFVHCHPKLVQNIVEGYLDDKGISYQSDFKDL